MEIIMDKNEILALSREENKGKDVADIEAQHRGAYAAYFVGILLIIAVDIIEGAVFNRISYGCNMAIFMMSFTAFITKYSIRRKKHELFVALMYFAIGVMWLVLWILQLCGVIR